MRIRSGIFWLAMAAWALPLQAAELEFETKRIDRSAMPRGGPVQVDFPFKNTSDRTITISNVGSSCGCTVARLEKNDYAPGDSGKITAVFTIGDRTGRQVKSLVVNTTDGESKARTQLVLAVEIDELMQLSRTVLLWRAGETPEPQRVTARMVIPDKWRIVGLTVDHEDVQAKLIPVEEGRLYEIEIVPVTTAQALRSEISLVLEESGGSGRQEVRLRARVR